MASTAPSKSRPLHNFELPRLKWNKDPKSSALHQRRRSFKSPMRRPNPSSLSPLIDSPMRDSVSATPPHRQSPLSDSVSTAAAPCLQSPLRDFVSAAAPRRRSPLTGSSAATPRRQSPSAATSFSSRESSDYSVKQSPFRGESSSKRMKKSAIGGDVAKRPPVPVDWTRKSQIGGELVNRSPVRGDSVRHFPGRDSELESSKRSKGAGFDGPKIGGFNSLNSEPMNKSERGTEKLEKKSKTVEVKKSSKLLIKIPCKNNKKKPVENLQEEPAKIEPIAEVNKADEVQEEEKINADDNNKNNNTNNNNNSNNNNNNNNNNNMSIDEEAKIWNLRPRKPKCKTLNGNGGGGAAKKGGSTMSEKNKAQSSPLKNVNSKSGGKEVCVGGSGEKKEKEKEKKKLTINVSLTKEEIEEDIFALTGSKPARRPKKRAKNIQKQLDYVFPGLWLVSITPETYKVSENYMKAKSKD